jgi:hypothetical protein
MQKPAAEEILPKPLGIFDAQVHLAWFDHIGKGELEEIFVQNLHDVRIGVNPDARQSIYHSHELAVAARIIGGPSPALYREEITSAELRAPELTVGWGHGSSAPASASTERVLGIDKACKVEIGSFVGSLERHLGQSQKGCREGKGQEHDGGQLPNLLHDAALYMRLE